MILSYENKEIPVLDADVYKGIADMKRTWDYICKYSGNYSPAQFYQQEAFLELCAEKPEEYLNYVIEDCENIDQVMVMLDEYGISLTPIEPVSG
jgi:hypothetical protein